MWKSFWRTWTVDKPALFGDWLWDVFVVQFSAFLDRLTVRQIIAFIPVLILVLAYCHRIPIPPELVLLGDLLAYIDIYALLLVVGMLSRMVVITVVIKQTISCAVELANSLISHARQLDFRHRREHGSQRQSGSNNYKNNEDEPALLQRFALMPRIAWA